MGSINLDKSFSVALAMRGMTKKQLAEDMGVSKGLITNTANKRGSMSVYKLDDAAALLGFKFSEFIALGED